MTTYPGIDLRLGADGMVPHAVLPDDGCCFGGLGEGFCATACSFLDLLPSGPMWDSQKAEAVRIVSAGGQDLCGPICLPEQSCPTMASYAVYAARILHMMVQTILWPSIREQDPQTAVSTLDDWLSRYAWDDCYRKTCGVPLEQSPYSYIGDCGPTLCLPSFPADFEAALKHAILVSLHRANRGIIKNLDGLNWVIAPLGAALSPRLPLPDEVQNFVDGSCEQEDPPCFCDVAEFSICQSGETIPAAPGLFSHYQPEAAPIPAKQSFDCNGEMREVYPGVVAAECIVRSLLTRKCPTILYRC